MSDLSQRSFLWSGDSSWQCVSGIRSRKVSHLFASCFTIEGIIQQEKSDAPSRTDD